MTEDTNDVEIVIDHDGTPMIVLDDPMAEMMKLMRRFNFPVFFYEQKRPPTK